MKKLLFALIIIFSVTLFAGHTSNDDKPDKGNWDFNLKKVWSVNSGAEELLIRSGQIRIDGEDNVYMMELKHGKIFKFDKDGKFITTIGKRGEGPGEFKMAFGFFIVGDEIVVPSMGGIFQYFGIDGKFNKSVNTGSFVFPRYYIDRDRFVWVRSDREGMGKKPEKISIYDLMLPECLQVPFHVKTKGEAIWKLIQLLEISGQINHPGEALQIILEREKQGGITLGQGIAILHGRIPNIAQSVISLGVCPVGVSVDFDGTIDDPIYIIYMIFSPAEKPELHLQVLAAIARLLSNPETRARLRNARDEIQALEIIKENS